MRKRSLLVRAAGVLLVASGCAPTETGNPPEDRKLLIGVTSSEPDEVAIAPNQGKVVVESAWHALQGIGYMSCDGTPLWLSEEPRAVELVGGRGLGVKEDPPPGTYCTLLMPTAPVAPSPGVPVELETYTFYMTGTRADGRAFEVVGDNIGLERPFANGTLERTADSAPLLLELDVARLYPSLDVERVLPDDDGVVRVDKSLSGDPGNFHSDWQSAWTIHSDDNRNGRVDAGEPELF